MSVVITPGEPVSIVKAIQDFFTRPPFGKKVGMEEFKALTRQDKVELREMLIDAGYDVSELLPEK